MSLPTRTDELMAGVSDEVPSRFHPSHPCGDKKQILHGVLGDPRTHRASSIIHVQSKNSKWPIIYISMILCK